MDHPFALCISGILKSIFQSCDLHTFLGRVKPVFGYGLLLWWGLVDFAQ